MLPTDKPDLFPFNEPTNIGVSVQLWVECHGYTNRLSIGHDGICEFILYAQISSVDMNMIFILIQDFNIFLLLL